MLMVANKLETIKVNKKLISFSRRNRGLIAKAYPWIKGNKLDRLCYRIDAFVRLEAGNESSAKEFLKGRVYGLMGAN